MSRSIGVVVVHGIGAQKPGETVRDLICGLQQGFKLPDPEGVALKDWCSKEGTEASFEAPAQPLEFELDDRTIRFYEVHWAEVLEGDVTHGSFNFGSLWRVVWFPWFNAKKGWYPSETYTPRQGRLRTVGLLILLVPLWLIYKGFGKIFNFLRNSESRKDAFAATLDETAGDVVNYVKSRAKRHTAESGLADVAEEICARFHEKVRRASEQCSEVWVIAHSLGTVVAYDALTGVTLEMVKAESNEGVEPFEKLTRFYTFGCPLEKILFFWPRLLGTKLVGRVFYGDGDSRPKRVAAEPHGTLSESFRWHNFHHWADAVAGKLRHFGGWEQFENHPLQGGSGFIRSHTLYFSHPTVHDMLGKDLLGPTVSRREVSSGLLKLLAENAGAFIAAALSLVVGLAVLATTLVVAAAAIATRFEPLREDPQMGLVVFVIIVGIVLFLLGGATWSRLKSLYKEHDEYGKKVS